MWSAASDGHWIMPSHVASTGHNSASDVHRLQRGQRSGRQWRRSLDANGANEMNQNAKGYEATKSQVWFIDICLLFISFLPVMLTWLKLC